MWLHVFGEGLFNTGGGGGRAGEKKNGTEVGVEYFFNVSLANIFNKCHKGCFIFFLKTIEIGYIKYELGDVEFYLHTGWG